MASRNISDQRIGQLNDRETADGQYVLYWMQQSQRAACNHALEFAVQRANELGLRLLVGFGLTDDYPDANLRHYAFMLQGLQQTETALKQRNIPLVVRLGDPAEVASELAVDAAEVVCDRGYLRHQRKWREQVANEAGCLVWQVESDAVVPLAIASEKQEYAARTIRPKINKKLDDYLRPLATTPLKKSSLSLGVPGESLDQLDQLLDSLSIDDSVKPIDEFPGGTSHAASRLREFLENDLSSYGERADPNDPHVSYLSPYLHFGQISPVTVGLKINSSKGHTTEQKEAFLEELIVRRELAFNFVYYAKHYDSLKCLPDWAAKTLDQHESDERKRHYTSTELEEAATHDPAWNAAMLEMKHHGYLHNHMRMYWGKKIIEWTNTVDHAHRTALELNNRYFLDGRDASSYTNIAWLFGLHDRAYQERQIFGKIRYMNDSGLARKFDVDKYIDQVAADLGVDIQGREKST